jgi:exonuclease VII small subunit
VSELDELQRILGDLDAINARLESGELKPGEATELLERITQLAQDAMAVLERRTQAIEE